MTNPSNLTMIDKVLKILNEMASTRDNFTNILRGFLRGALGEYVCITIAKEIGVPDNWSYEVGKLTSQVSKYMNPNMKKKTFKDREKVLQEVMVDVSFMHDKVLDAKNKMIGYYPKKWKQIQLIKIDSEEEFKKMIIEYLPKYKKMVKNL